MTIGAAGAFVELFAATLPHLLTTIRRDLSESPLDRLDCEIEMVDFSRDVLSRVPERLFVLRDGPSGWTDFGSLQRAMDVLQVMASS